MFGSNGNRLKGYRKYLEDIWWAVTWIMLSESDIQRTEDARETLLDYKKDQ